MPALDTLVSSLLHAILCLPLLQQQPTNGSCLPEAWVSPLAIKENMAPSISHGKQSWERHCWKLVTGCDCKFLAGGESHYWLICSLHRTDSACIPAPSEKRCQRSLVSSAFGSETTHWGGGTTNSSVDQKQINVNNVD